ncbi:glycosyltransferase [Agromyces seonyuensis]|uniref:Glycosyltransferase n=1 Tax=Agromyces seonyuensis TaxID=2662446 RepID=A0A6I4NSM8_9MICO|nr:glycosyltransferase family 2 protein [Agromyces seonyuensis]MWB97263.1 glycosyltransferase [Agromyces seonyuensis]
MNVSIIVPTFNEGPNIAELLRRIAAVLPADSYEVLFVDDSTDDTPAIVTACAAESEAPVRLIHRDAPDGGLGGAVVEGLAAARNQWCVVMDGDLQHPPEVLPRLIERAGQGDADVVVASRYAAGGTSAGLAGWLRTAVSRLSTLVTKAMFPVRLRACSDPMTGFFLVDRDAVRSETLKPRGFKILLEILARARYRVAEVPFDFAERFAGRSKASFLQGLRFLLQLTMLRFGRMSGFAVIGAIGAVANLLIMAGLQSLGLDYLWAAIIASEITIIGNFLLIEHFVFADLRSHASATWSRFAKSFAFNNAEAVIRIPAMSLLIEATHIPSVLAAAITLIIAFVVRFVFHSLVVYAPKHLEDAAADPAATSAARVRTVD